MNKIVISGSGALGTALAQVIALHHTDEITLLSIEPDVIGSINEQHVNARYFPQIRLQPNVRATDQPESLKGCGTLFFAVPSTAVVANLKKLQRFLEPDALLVNLSKGLGENNSTLVENMRAETPNPVCTLKGPAFARELINQVPTGMTVGAYDISHYHRLKEIFRGTPVHLDYSSDVNGVELLSVLKNIYAIIIGIVDAHFDSANLRFMVLTRAFNEMKDLLKLLGGETDTLFNYCGIGDFGLTSLNDLSRNRTLGLLIGKGFFTEQISDKVVLEGKIAAHVMHARLSAMGVPAARYPLLDALVNIFTGKFAVKDFVPTVLNNRQ